MWCEYCSSLAIVVQQFDTLAIVVRHCSAVAIVVSYCSALFNVVCVLLQFSGQCGTCGTAVLCSGQCSKLLQWSGQCGATQFQDWLEVRQ